MGLTDPSKRLEAMPPYMFAELERKVSEMKERGIDVISLGIGDPDMPTFPAVVEAMRKAVGENSNQKYPTNRGRVEFRRAMADFYAERFGVEIDSEDGVMPAIGAKEAIYNLCFAFLDPGDVALASDPGYPVYTGGPVLAGAEPVSLPLLPERGFAPDLDRIPEEVAARARIMFLNYPNNPTGAVVPDGFFEEAVDFARRNEILVIHDNAYSETTFDGYVAPSFLATPGAMDVGLEVFSLSKGYNMTGWRVGWMHGPAKIVEACTTLQQYTFVCAPQVGQWAGLAALDCDMTTPLAECRRKRDRLVEALAGHYRFTVPGGAFYLYPEAPGGSGQAFADRAAAREQLLVVPGNVFGRADTHFRIAYTVPDAVLERGIAALVRLARPAG